MPADLQTPSRSLGRLVEIPDSATYVMIDAPRRLAAEISATFNDG